MSDALETVMREWCVPRMRVRRVIGLTMSGNKASGRVFEKNGFVFQREHKAYKEVRGEQRGLVIFEQVYPSR